MKIGKVDYDMLLAEAVKQWEERNAKLEKLAKEKQDYLLAHGPDALHESGYQELDMQDIDAKIKYQRWVKENITVRDIIMLNDQETGKPIKLYIEVTSND